MILPFTQSHDVSAEMLYTRIKTLNQLTLTNKPAGLTHGFSHRRLGVQLLGQPIIPQLDQVGFGKEDVQCFDVPSRQTHSIHSVWKRRCFIHNQLLRMHGCCDFSLPVQDAGFMDVSDGRGDLI